ncbi:MAG: zinc-ribbon domain-containing protein [Alphaproteobacteria bacterium]|nr:zinc-ribbon domain-containing protein [Alphaproteobacteria bacterium]
MIITCPSCSTRYDLPGSRLGVDATMIKCAACGYGWLEGKATEITTTPNIPTPASINGAYEPDSEIRRLVNATREAQEVFAVQRTARLRRMAAWYSLGVAVILPIAFAFVSPETVVKIAPAAIKAYAALGHTVNIYGLDLRSIEMQHMLVDGTRILAVKGEIANTSGQERKIPWLRFGLNNDEGSEVYSWTLDAGARPLKSGEITNFVTRVASPPETAKDLQIRFAHANEIGSNTQP